jgi:hypothetical protein
MSGREAATALGAQGLGLGGQNQGAFSGSNTLFLSTLALLSKELTPLYDRRFIALFENW